MEYKITEKISKKVIEEVLKVKKEEGLTAQAILKQAQKKTSKLHDLFEWNNTKAGELWRLQQARVFINEIKIIIEEKEYYAFENVSIQTEANESSREYFERSEILSDETLRQQVIAKALEQLKYWKEKYKQYNEFEPIIKQIEAFEKTQKIKEVA